MKDLISIGITYVPQKRFPSHSHPVWEIVYYTLGTGYNLIAGKKIPFSPGTIICQPPKIPHEEVAETEFRNMTIFIREFGFPDPEPIVTVDNADMDFLAMMKQLYAHCHSGRDNKRLFDALLGVLHEFIAEFRVTVVPHPEIENFKRALALGFSDPGFSLSKALADVPLCRDHFRRVFKEDTGKTPVEYLTDMRLSHAMQLMRSSSMPLKSVCAMCGFEDQFYFSRIFKKYIGKNPREWKKTISFPS